MKNYISMMAMALFLALPLQAAAQDISEDRVRELVLETIRENPEIVMEAVAILEARQAEAQAASQAEVLSRERDTLERDPNAPVLGNPEGDVTVVEFFDYNCPYCRRAKPEIEALLAADPDVRLVYREWPILGEGSVFAALCRAGRARTGALRRLPLGADGHERPRRGVVRPSDRGRHRPGRRAIAPRYGSAGDRRTHRILDAPGAGPRHHGYAIFRDRRRPCARCRGRGTAKFACF